MIGPIRLGTINRWCRLLGFVVSIEVPDEPDGWITVALESSRRWPLTDKGPQGTGEPSPTVCELPPPGWACTREPDHEGPCAAIPWPAGFPGNAAR